VTPAVGSTMASRRRMMAL